MSIKGVAFTDSENTAIKTARAANPKMPQRQLATTIYNDSVNVGSPVAALGGRTKASIYSAIRRFDRVNNSKTTAKQIKTMGGARETLRVRKAFKSRSRRPALV